MDDLIRVFLIRTVSGVEDKLAKARKQQIRDTADLGALTERSIALIVVETEKPDERERQRQAAEAVKKEEQARREAEERRLELARRANEEQRQRQEELNKLQLRLQVLNQRENDIIREGTMLKQRHATVMSQGTDTFGTVNPLAVYEAARIVSQMEPLQRELLQIRAQKQQVLSRMSELSR